MSKKDNRKNVQYATLLSVLAQGSTDGARSILKKYSGQDAKNLTDLEVKLANMYSNSPKKLDIEKDFADIHPHKDFILKYNQPKPIVVEKVVEKEPIKSEVVLSTSNFDGHPPCGNPNCPRCNKFFNCDGNPNCSCNKSSSACGCGGSSSFEGETNILKMPNTQLMIVGVVGVVAIFGMFLYLNEKK